MSSCITKGTIYNQLTELQRIQIDKHLSLVIDANKITNLTRIETPEQGAILHIEDSLSALSEINCCIDGLYGDLGTGGGYPGIPLAISTGRKTVLIDSVKKKVAILDDIVAELKLSEQIDTYAGRIEDLAIEKRETFAVLTARALSSLPSLLELASPLLCQHGRLICFKATVTEEELTHAKSLKQKLAMKFVSKREFTLSDQQTNRTILVFERVGQPGIKLPRKMSMAQKKPL